MIFWSCFVKLKNSLYAYWTKSEITFCLHLVALNGQTWVNFIPIKIFILYSQTPV